MQATGANARILFDEETIFKTDPTTPDGKLIPFVSCSIKGEQEFFRDNAIRGRRDAYKPIPGNLKVGGSLVVNLSETAHAKLLKHLLGSVQTTGVSDPYTHTIKVGSLPVSFLIEKGFTDINEYHKFNGCRINSAEFSVAQGGLVRATFNILGSKETRSSTPYDSTPTEYIYEPFTSFQAVIQEGGVDIAIVTDFTLTISNELDEGGYVIDGSIERAQLPEGNVLVTGKIEALFDGDTLLAKARNSTETSLKITMNKGVTPARTCEIFVPELVFKRTGPEISGPKGVKISLDFEAYYNDSTDQSSVKITLQNGLQTI